MAVIGYKGSPAERLNNWIMMLNYKKHDEVFGNKTDEWSQRVLKQAQANYKRKLRSYIKEAA